MLTLLSWQLHQGAVKLRGWQKGRRDITWKSSGNAPHWIAALDLDVLLDLLLGGFQLPTFFFSIGWLACLNGFLIVLALVSFLFVPL